MKNGCATLWVLAAVPDFRLPTTDYRLLTILRAVSPSRHRRAALLAAELREELIVIHRAREHRVVLVGCEPLLFLAQRRGAVFQGNNVVAFFVPRAHGRLHAAIGEKSAKRDR